MVRKKRNEHGQELLTVRAALFDEWVEEQDDDVQLQVSMHHYALVSRGYTDKAAKEVLACLYAWMVAGAKLKEVSDVA